MTQASLQLQKFWGQPSTPVENFTGQDDTALDDGAVRDELRHDEVHLRHRLESLGIRPEYESVSGETTLCQAPEW